MADGVRVRSAAVLPPLAFVVSAVLQAALTFGPAHVRTPLDWAISTALGSLCPITGLLLSWRVPANPVGIALGWVGAAPAVVFTIEAWGDTALTAHPWPAARLMFVIQLGAWVWNLAGFVALCLVFPDGALPTRRWRRLVWTAVAVGVLVNVAIPLDQRRSDVPVATRFSAAVHVPGPIMVITLVLAFGGILAVLGLAIASLALRYRRGDETARQQLRWLILGAGTVPVLLAGGWIASALGASTSVAFSGFMLAMAVAIPAAVAVAVLRHDLFDVDRLLGSSLAWLGTSLVSAAIFAGVVYAATDIVGAGSGLGATGAAFITAICLLPLHRRLNDIVGRLVDRERTVIRARVNEFVRQVRDGQAEPEAAEALMRVVLRDPSLRLLIRLPGSPADAYVDLAGTPANTDGECARVSLTSGASEVGVIVLGSSSARRLRQVREVALQARLPIEVSRLRLELRGALGDVRSSRERLVHATVAERQRLARDLHDGAQQQIVAVGMRLRSVQRQLDPTQAAHGDLESAITTLTGTVRELRRLAHGVRPGPLEDGLSAALRALVADSPVPVDVEMADFDTSEIIATTVYFVVAEAMANALKHARATAIGVLVAQRAGTLHVEVHDNGIGGASSGYGLTSVRDRVSSVGGNLSVHSPPGAGTRIKVAI